MTIIEKGGAIPPQWFTKKIRRDKNYVQKNYK